MRELYCPVCGHIVPSDETRALGQSVRCSKCRNKVVPDATRPHTPITNSSGEHTNELLAPVVPATAGEAVAHVDQYRIRPSIWGSLLWWCLIGLVGMIPVYVLDLDSGRLVEKSPPRQGSSEWYQERMRDGWKEFRDREKETTHRLNQEMLRSNIEQISTRISQIENGWAPTQRPSRSLADLQLRRYVAIRLLAEERPEAIIGGMGYQELARKCGRDPDDIYVINNIAMELSREDNDW